MKSIQNRIFKSITARGRGSAFTPSDFLRLGSRSAVDQALSRLARAGKIRRLGRGLYDFPLVHPKLGILAPSSDDVAKALARNVNGRLQVSGARAANLLGFTTQVPAKLIYATDGRPRMMRFGRKTIELRKAAARRMVGASTPAGAVLQALRHLGPEGVTDDVVRKLAHTLSTQDKMHLKRLLRAAPVWLHHAIDQIAALG